MPRYDQTSPPHGLGISVVYMIVDELMFINHHKDLLHSVGVIIPAFQSCDKLQIAGDPGSIPGVGIFCFCVSYLSIICLNKGGNITCWP